MSDQNATGGGQRPSLGGLVTIMAAVIGAGAGFGGAWAGAHVSADASLRVQRIALAEEQQRAVGLARGIARVHAQELVSAAGVVQAMLMIGRFRGPRSLVFEAADVRDRELIAAQMMLSDWTAVAKAETVVASLRSLMGARRGSPLTRPDRRVLRSDRDALFAGALALERLGHD